MKPINLQERRQPPSAQTVWIVEEQAATRPMVLVSPKAPLSLWRSAMQRRVSLPRLQFNKGMRVDVMA